MRPFIPFPIFPPYAHWRANQETRLPSNDQVAARLDALDPSFNPFLNTWYAHRYVNWIAFSWNPQRPKHLYYTCAMALEKMLNWSFANEVSMIDWTREDFVRYADFVAKPDPSWCATSRQARFIPSVQRGFRDWVINPDWLPFDASRAAGAENEIDGNVWKREIRIVTQFLNYYLKDVGTNRLNVAKAPLSHLLLKHPTAREIISDVEMTWIIRNLERLLPSSDFQSIELCLTIARYSSQRLDRVIGSSTNPGHLDQFVLDESGRWLERNADGVGWKRLSVEFDEVFTRYLHYHNIDGSHLLPALPIFPVENARGALGLKKLGVILAGSRETLGQLADASNSAEIRGAARKFRGLTVVAFLNSTAQRK